MDAFQEKCYGSIDVPMEAVLRWLNSLFAFLLSSNGFCLPKDLRTLSRTFTTSPVLHDCSRGGFDAGS